MAIRSMMGVTWFPRESGCSSLSHSVALNLPGRPQDVGRGTSGGLRAKAHPLWTPAFPHALHLAWGTLLSAQLRPPASPRSMCPSRSMAPATPRPWAQAGATSRLWIQSGPRPQRLLFNPQLVSASHFALLWGPAQPRGQKCRASNPLGGRQSPHEVPGTALGPL